TAKRSGKCCVTTDGIGKWQRAGTHHLDHDLLVARDRRRVPRDLDSFEWIRASPGRLNEPHHGDTRPLCGHAPYRGARSAVPRLEPGACLTETVGSPGRRWRREGRMAGRSATGRGQVAASAFCRVWLTNVSVASSSTRPRRPCGGWM